MGSTILRPGHVLMLVALLQVCGGHWLALQSLAWTEMIVNYSQHSEFSEAVAKTFDGRHPCALCESIESGKKQERRAPLDGTTAKPLFLLVESVALIRGDGSVWDQVLPVLAAETRAEQPSVPPPRAAV